MRVNLARWGNSLGLRIPKEVAERAGLSAGSQVDVEARRGRIVISPARPHYELEELLVGMTPAKMRDAFDWGSDVGREAVAD